LRREAQACRRWNILHPDQKPRKSYLEECVDGLQGPFLAASDYVCALPEQLTPWIPGEYRVLGTDGMGRSETREALRRHFDVDAESITLATLYELQLKGDVSAKEVAQAIKDLGIDPEKIDPVMA
jgi:pyruvate dehydrogenase E1 component